jgi:hypothetical protein
MKKRETELEKYVYDELKDMAEKDYPIKSVYKDLQQGGCASGFIGSLIYYEDTTAFYKKFQDEIDALLADTIENFGGGPADVFGDKWDKSDPLARQKYNQNLLAWFAFEETAYRLFEN